MKVLSLLLVMVGFMLSTFINSSSSEMATEIVLNNVEGEMLKLSDVKGNYVLVDFWASWCKPCCKSRPDLKKVYDKYKSETKDGIPYFEIYSVSFDKNKENWVKGISKYELGWINHVSSLNGFKSPVVKDYNIKGIPNNVLLNSKGEIVKRNISFEALDQFLAKN